MVSGLKEEEYPLQLSDYILFTEINGREYHLQLDEYTLFIEITEGKYPLKVNNLSNYTF